MSTKKLHARHTAWCMEIDVPNPKMSPHGGAVKSNIHRSIHEWLPVLTGAVLIVLLFWGLFVASSPGSEAKVLEEEHDIQHEQLLNQEDFHTDSHTDVSDASAMPENPDISILLNKKVSIDPLLNHSFRLGPKISDWDERREIYIKDHPHSNVSANGKPKIFMVTGSQPQPCQNLVGDHMLVRAIKNKIDYCRLHKLELYYNSATLSHQLPSWWVKLPLIRSLMIAHPEVEWFWWVDSDVVFTDITFDLPIEKYADYNFVLHGWDSLIYGERSWTGLNMGIFLVRNCQWTLDLFDTLAPMGVQGHVADKIGVILTLSLKYRPTHFQSDDQGAFIYLLNAEKEKWGDKVYLENSYYLNGYWKILVDKFESYEQSGEPGYGDDRWPFVTHFTGCQICSGKINDIYTPEECRHQMERALNLADNQVLKAYGFQHVSLETTDLIHTSENR